MSTCLIIGKISNSYQDHVSKKTKTDALIELQKITKSFNGEYLLRKGIVCSCKYDAFAIIKFSSKSDLEGNRKAVQQSGLMDNLMCFELDTIEAIETTIINVSKRIKFADKVNDDI